MEVTVVLPGLHLVNPTNVREHWSKRARRAKRDRVAAWGAMLSRSPLPEPPCVVTITRISPRALDSDNLQAACKSVRDGVADALRVKDNDPRVTWCYFQQQSEDAVYGVRIHLRRA